jgi:hypothetical protein
VSSAGGTWLWSWSFVWRLPSLIVIGI